VGEAGLKIITDETFIEAKIITINKTIFRHAVSELPRIKMHIDCEMERCDYDWIKYISVEETPYTISFSEDLVLFGINEFIPPFDASTIYISGQYDGIKYQVALVLAQI
jgi:hypothetical protein